MSEQVFDDHIISQLGAVVIGRNEGERLKQCLTSLRKGIKHIVYVDSGSTDGSVELALSLDVEVVSLDLSQPFTAARARNAGLTKLVANYPALDYVQFVDGDCEVQPGWLVNAMDFLQNHPDFAAVCGRRRERYPDASIYNLLCDIEWDTPVGEAKACGGDALFRLTALQAVDGYRESLIAGEEPEMCLRMRQLGWKIMRLNVEMTLHDAAMTRIGQWWKRNQRAGHAFAEAYAIHGQSTENFRRSECKSILFWALLLPMFFIGLSLWQPELSVLFLVYPLQIARLILRYQHRFQSLKQSILYSVSNVFGKWPQLMGMVEFKVNSLRGIRSHLIEYK
ncbi:glycosyltransferase [Methylophaga pinxianii]|uniref:glycosyltransferase n=1 Tax=Methylophaga pinxianii TaxID=2881052 RepID=UPI001CF14576|nr:glycosyltransferase family 2 protein [Methylophaga pinxianii]MCB2426636.1 glycosyltransferase [Methylophaga pinxianii]UPH45104.1 glycosyltransferase [Methylophaga pinxianii]